MMGLDLARSESFASRLMDGGSRHPRELCEKMQQRAELYVKISPGERGSLDGVVMLFYSPAAHPATSLAQD